MEKIDIILEQFIKASSIKDVNKNKKESRASNTFKTLILMAATNEKDLPKLIKLKLLKNLECEYDLSNYKIGKKYKKELEEIKKGSPLIQKLNKYETLSYIYGVGKNMIDNGIAYDTFLNVIKRLLSIDFNLQDEMQVLPIIRNYELNLNLTTKERAGWDNEHWNIKGRRETISEHIIETMIQALILDSELDLDIDIDEVLTTLLIHETGECTFGDKTPFDGLTPEQKKEQEQKAMKEVLRGLEYADVLFQRLVDFDDKIGNNNLFAYLCDKFNADFNAKLYQDKGMHRELEDQENNVVMGDPKIQKIIKNGAKTPFDCWYGYDIEKFANNKTFPVFEELLNTVKNTNLVKEKNKKQIKEN